MSLKNKIYTIEQLCSAIIGGGTPPTKIADYWHGDIPWISSADISELGKIVIRRFVNEDAIKNSTTNLVAEGTVIIVSRVGIGKAAIAPYDLCFSQDCQGLILKKDLINEQYFINAIQKSLKTLITKARGATITGVTKEEIKNLKISVPPLSEQIRIATILSKVEALIAQRKESLKLLDELLRSTFMEMFIANGSAKDGLVAVESLAKTEKGSMRTGPFGSDLLHSEFTENGEIKVLGIDNVVNNFFEEGEPRYINFEKFSKLNRYRVWPKDVLITIMGTTGRTAVVPENIPLSINTKHLAAISLDLDKANPYFLSYSLRYNPFIIKQLKDKTRGAIMDGLNLGIIKSLKLHRPTIEIQNHFAQIVVKVETLKTQYKASLKELENLYASLSQRAFKGELDLSRVVIDEAGSLSNGQKDDPIPERPLDFSNDFPEELWGWRTSNEQYLSFYEAFLKKHFVNKSFNQISVEELFTQIYAPKGLIFSYEIFKELVLKALKEEKPFLRQSFDEKKKQIKLEVVA